VHFPFQVKRIFESEIIRFGDVYTSQHMQRLMGGRHTGGDGGWGGSGLANINLEQHDRRDQIVRVARATVAEVVSDGHTTGSMGLEA